jgi:hypothetical protein
MKKILKKGQRVMIINDSLKGFGVPRGTCGKILFDPSKETNGWVKWDVGLDDRIWDALVEDLCPIDKTKAKKS